MKTKILTILFTFIILFGLAQIIMPTTSPVFAQPCSSSPGCPAPYMGPNTCINQEVRNFWYCWYDILLTCIPTQWEDMSYHPCGWVPGCCPPPPCDPRNGQECDSYGCCSPGNVESECYKQYDCSGNCVYAGYRNEGAYCGNGSCACNENSSNCPADCTPPATCPNGACDNGETCNTCPQDCGACPPTPTSPPGSTPTPTSPVGVPPCDPSQLSMSASPNPVALGSTIRFSESGTQGSTWLRDTFSGGVSCPGFPVAWPTNQTCNTTANGSFTWTHYWKNCAPGNCGIFGPECSKSLSYTISSPCSATVPMNLNVTNRTTNSATLNWTPGSGGTRQLLRVATTQAIVDSGCTTGPCIIKEDNLPTNQSSYNTGAVFSPATRYYWRVVTYNSGSCWRDASSNFYTLGFATIAGNLYLDTNGDACWNGPPDTSPPPDFYNNPQLTAILFSGEGGNSPCVVTNKTTYSCNVIAPVSGTGNASYNLQFTAGSIDPYSVSTCKTGSADTPSCSGSCTGIAAVANQTARRNIEFKFGAWFQTWGGNVHSQIDIRSRIPSSAIDRNFSRDLDSYPGVVAYGGASASFAPSGIISSRNWLSQSSWGSPTSYNYDYFYKRAGNPTNPQFTGSKPACNPGSPATLYSYAPGNVTAGNWTVNSGEKCMIFVNGNLTLGPGKILVSQGGFLAFIVKGNITILSNLGNNPASANRDDSNIEGFYLTDGTFDTSASNTDLERFVGRGVFVAWGGFRLQRNLDAQGKNRNKDYAAELFSFRPDLFVNAPKEIQRKPMSWIEVAP